MRTPRGAWSTRPAPSPEQGRPDSGARSSAVDSDRVPSEGVYNNADSTAVLNLDSATREVPDRTTIQPYSTTRVLLQLKREVRGEMRAGPVTTCSTRCSRCATCARRSLPPPSRPCHLIASAPHWQREGCQAGPKIYERAHVSLREHSCEWLRLARLLGRHGVFLSHLPALRRLGGDEPAAGVGHGHHALPPRVRLQHRAQPLHHVGPRVRSQCRFRYRGAEYDNAEYDNTTEP
jgi:hypothetical protein